MRKLKMTSGLLQENSFIVITLNPESNCTCRKKKHFLFQWSTSTLPEQHIHHWMYCWRKRLKITGTWMDKEFSDAWTGFTRFVLLKGRPPEGYTWSGERLSRKQTTSRPDDVWPDMWKFMSDAARKKAKQRWAIEKPKVDNARQLRGIFFIEPNDEEFKLTMKAARRKLEVPMPAAIPCKIPIKSSGENHRNIGKRKTKYAYPTKARD